MLRRKFVKMIMVASASTAITSLAAPVLAGSGASNGASGPSGASNSASNSSGASNSASNSSGASNSASSSSGASNSASRSTASNSGSVYCTQDGICSNVSSDGLREVNSSDLNGLLESFN